MTAHTTNNTKRIRIATAFGLIAALGLTATMMAGEAFSGASAGMGPIGPGTATATAGYTGNGQGIANTNTHSGNNFSFGRGVSFGIDEDGVSLSASHAIATRNGPAVATTFNMSIGFNGSVASSRGGSVASGGIARTAEASGSAGIHRGNPVATARAGGHTVRGGRVRAFTDSRTQRSVEPRRIVRRLRR